MKLHRIVLISLAVLLVTSTLLLPAQSVSARTRLVRRIQIPAIGVNLAITVAPFRKTTWNFSRILYQAAYLAGRPQPGQSGNVVIAAHSEFARRRPGPFYHLNQLKAGDQIIVLHDGARYVYAVTSTWSVDPTDMSPIIQTDQDVLTLITCDGYNDLTHGYDTRLIVRAARVA